MKRILHSRRVNFLLIKKREQKEKRKICSQIAKMNYLTKIRSSFDFKRILPSKSIENLNDVGPSLVMASQVGLEWLVKTIV